MDSHDAPLGDLDLALPNYRHPSGYGLGVHSFGLGRILGLGPRGKRIAYALDYRHGFLAFCDDAREKRNDEGLEYGAGIGHLPA